MSRHRSLALAAVLACACASAADAGAETIYDQPYLGDRLASPPRRELAAQIAAADLIVVGRTRRLVEHPGGAGGAARIEATVDPLEVWKGKRPGGGLALEWTPSATSLSVGSTHVLLVELGRSSRVLREMYVHAPPYGRMRTFGAMDGDKEATFRVVRALIDPKAPRAGLSDVLLREARARGQRGATAARLAIELDASDSIAALTEIVANRGEDYADAAYTLVRLSGAPGIRAVLDSLRGARGPDRIHETDAFAAIAAVGGAAAVPIVSDFGAKHLQFRVSAAFALAKLGGPDARKQIDAWLADPSSAAKERISTGWTVEEPARAELYRRARSAIRP